MTHWMRDFKLKENEKREFVGKGVEAVDHALQIKPDYMEALVYKNLLLRLQANPMVFENTEQYCSPATLDTA